MIMTIKTRAHERSNKIAHNNLDSVSYASCDGSNLDFEH